MFHNETSSEPVLELPRWVCFSALTAAARKHVLFWAMRRPYWRRPCPEEATLFASERRRHANRFMRPSGRSVGLPRYPSIASKRSASAPRGLRGRRSPSSCVASLTNSFPKLADRAQVVGDAVIALEAAFGPGPGVIAISGTGSMIYGRDAKGLTARAGGWGFAVSDEGSGHWIGQKAISSILRARDAGRETSLDRAHFGRLAP